MTAACLLHPEREAPDASLVSHLIAVPASCVSDACGRSGAAVGLYPLAGVTDHTRVAGPALTVRTEPGDNLVVHRAADLLRPGDVLVVDAGGALDRAIAGGLLLRYAAVRGAVAAVIDGVVRDLPELADIGMPVYARGVCPHGPSKNASGEIRGRITVGGTSVEHRDIVVGDRDGVVIVPAGRAVEVADEAQAIAAREEMAVAAIDSGHWERPWVDRLALCHVTESERLNA